MAGRLPYAVLVLVVLLAAPLAPVHAKAAGRGTVTPQQLLAKYDWTSWPDAKCIECHAKVTPGIVVQYLEGAMGKPGVQNPEACSSDECRMSIRLYGGRVPCTVCHGSQHTTSSDWSKARLPDYHVCEQCHPVQVEEYLKSKHALAWKAMMVVAGLLHLPREVLLLGCAKCHEIGVKTPEELKKLGLDRPYGIGGCCDQCHTRHRFSAEEARHPETCAKCHMGFDHPQWEMWSHSKHGLIYLSEKQLFPFNVSLADINASAYPAPTCQVCHMPHGNHTVITAWGFLGLVAFKGRPDGLRIVQDKEWEEAEETLLKALGVLGPDGKPTPLLKVVVELKMVRTSPQEFMAIRKQMIKTCTQCHSRSYVLEYFREADEAVRDATIELAKAIKAVAEAREEGVLPKRPDNPSNPYPFLLLFYEAPTKVERQLFKAFMEYRMRVIEGAFHVNPDYLHWYGWAELYKTVKDIQEELKHLKELKEEEKGESMAPAQRQPTLYYAAALPAALAPLAIVYERRRRSRSP